MDIYICHDCKTVFRHPVYEREIHHELGTEEYEEFGVCPECGSEDYSMCEQCEICGCYIEFTELVGNADVCKKCKELIDTVIDNHLTEMEREIRSKHDATGVNLKDLLINRMADAF